jgi:hypothetical protein
MLCSPRRVAVEASQVDRVAFPAGLVASPVARVVSQADRVAFLVTLRQTLRKVDLRFRT